MPHPARRTVTRGHQQLADAPSSADCAPERRLVLALIARAILDAYAMEPARAWLESPAFAEWCSLVDLPADRLRAWVAADPSGVRRALKTLSGQMV